MVIMAIIKRRLQTLAILTWCILAFLIPFGIFIFIFVSILNPILALIYISWIYYDRKTKHTGGRRIEFFRRLKIWTYCKDYFPLKLIKTCDLDCKKNYLFGAYPHGIFCVGSFINFSMSTKDFKKLFPNMMTHLLTIDTNFWIPFTRELLLTFGLCSASKKSMNYLLSFPKGGKIVILYPGGVEEQFVSKPNTNVIMLKNRKGFIKIALQNGSPLVPIYTFGETNLYNQYHPYESTLRNIQLLCIKIFGFYPPIVSGRTFYKNLFWFLPKRLPITTVVGSPIEVKKINQPTQQEIDSLHDKFINSLKMLFYNHRKECGYPNAQLEIV